MSSDSRSESELTELPFNDENTGLSVQAWCLIVKGIYLSKPVSREWKVVQVERYKKSSHPQHEYMVASLEHPTNKPIDIRIERSRPHVGLDGKPILFDNQPDLSPEQWVPGTQPTTPTPPPRPNMVSSLSDSSAKKTLADDRVKKHSPQFLSRDTRIERLSLRGNPIPLVHLAILAKTVHDNASLYNLFEAQCFWFADMIVRVIAKQRNQSDQLSEGSQEERYFSTRSGTYYMIPVHNARPAVVQEIENAFNERWNDFFANEVTETLAEENRILSLGNTIEEMRRQAAERERATAERERATAAELAAERVERERVVAEKDNELSELRKLLAQSRQGGQTSA